MLADQNEFILYLSEKDVKKACAQIDSVAVMRQVFLMHSSGQTLLPDEAYLSWTNSSGESVRNLNMPGYLGGSWNVAGTKIINGNIHNPQRGLPRASGLTLLFDDTSARIVCIMEGAYISSLRTASVTALAVDLLMDTRVECLAIIGAGVLARVHIELLVRRLPFLQQILIFDLDPKKVAQLQKELASLLLAHQVMLRPTTSAEEAIRPAQLVVPATTTMVGYIPFAWLQPGTLLINVSLDDPLPEVVVRADMVIVDDWNLVKNDTRRLLGRMYRAGKIIGPDEKPTHNGQRQIDAQLGEIVSGMKKGRLNAHDVILVNPFGLAIEDVAFAAHIYQYAQSFGLGIRLER